MWVGYLRSGALGALLVAVPFILPSYLIVVVVAFFYRRYQGLSEVQSLFYGIAPAVMAIIAIAAIKLARLTNQKDLRLWMISAAIMVVTALTASEIALLFIAAGLLMIMLDAPPKFPKRRVSVFLPVTSSFALGGLDRHARRSRTLLPKSRGLHLRKRARHRPLPS
ncbi:MAG: chromate transporter [Actinomycetota bacterium]